MNIHNFDSKIESKIVYRGHAYYQDGSITYFEQADERDFIATVLGTKRYQVRIILSPKHDIFYHSCDCPYDWGNYCKHEVAVLYRIRETQAFQKEVDDSGNIGKIRKELAKYDAPALRVMLIDIVKTNWRIRNELLEEFGYQMEEDDFDEDDDDFY